MLLGGACVLIVVVFLMVRQRAPYPVAPPPAPTVAAVSPPPATELDGDRPAVPGHSGSAYAAPGALIPPPQAVDPLPGAAATPLPPGTAPSEPGASPPLEAKTAVEAVRSAIQKYGATFGGNPVGTNAEITRTLNGNNPTHTLFLSGIPGQGINSNGELVDPWGTPYFFHQLSGYDMEVRSAGPDRIMWNGDDIVFK